MTSGRVVLVPFPFDDRSATKVRPAVCLSEPVGPFKHVTVAFVTSRMPLDLLATDLVIAEGQDGFSATGLRITSVVRLHRLLTIGAESITRDLGSVSGPLQNEIQERLRLVFGL